MWWWFIFAQLCGTIILLCLCCIAMQCTFCRLPRALRRLRDAIKGLILWCVRPQMVDKPAQVEIHDLEGMTVPGLKYLLGKMEFSTAGTRDVLVTRLHGVFEGRRRVWDWFIGFDARAPTLPPL